jgi:hypothetical protein
VTTGSVVCVCGRVAEDGDIECSLCGRDLSSLPTGPHDAEESCNHTFQTRVPPGPTTAPDLRSNYERSYSEPAASPASGFQRPPDGWATTWPEPPHRAPVISDRGRVVGIVIGAIALIVAGFALGYLAIADMLTGRL